MTWREWIAEFDRRAREANDAERLRLLSVLYRSFALREREPEQFLAACEEGRRLAGRLREPWWVLCFEAEAVHELIHYVRDFRRALELAVAAVLEARKPIYDGCPVRERIYQDLLAVHFCIDPDGYADRIEEGFRDMEPLIGHDLGSRLHLLNLRRWWAEQSRQPEEHYAAAQRVLLLAAEDPDNPAALHYATFVYNGLCHVNFAQDRWQELGETAALAEEASRKVGNQVELAESFLWQALAALQGGQAGGHRLRKRGIQVMEGLGVPPPDGYFTALGFCHEQAGRLDEALALRERERALLQSQGRTISEVYCHRHRCRLLARLGRLTDDDVEAGRAAARRLRFPDSHLAELDRLAAS
jgi:hypothetical protein